MSDEWQLMSFLTTQPSAKGAYIYIYIRDIISVRELGYAGLRCMHALWVPRSQIPSAATSYSWIIL